MTTGKKKAINPIWFGFFCAVIVIAMLSVPLGFVPQDWLSVDARLPLLIAAGILAGLYAAISERKKQLR